jgi:phosphohistidine phosphatase
MDLILWRHAEAEDGVPDEKRMLTAKGRKQAARMARWLEQRLPAHYLVLASPALRTQQTAGALGKVVVREELGLSATAQGILHAAQWPRAEQPVVIVGHQPTLGMTAALLLGGEGSPAWSVRKGAILWFARKESQIVLRAVLSPDLL